MPNTNPMKEQLAALQARMSSVTETATPEDIVLLSKAVETLAGKATVFDIVDAGDAQKAVLENLSAGAALDLTALAQAQAERVMLEGGIALDALQEELGKHAAFDGATPTAAGGPGMVPAPLAGQHGHVLHGNGQWIDPVNAPVGSFAFIPPGQLGERWLHAYGGVVKIEDYPLLAATQKQKRNMINNIYNGTEVVGATYANNDVRTFNQDIETGHVLCIGSAGVALAPNGQTFNTANFVPKGSFIFPIYRNDILAYFSAVKGGGWIFGTLVGGTYIETSTTVATDVSASYAVGGICGENFLVAQHISTPNASNVYLYNTTTQETKQLTFANHGAKDIERLISGFVHVGNTVFFAAKTKINNNATRVFYSTDNGKIWLVAEDADTGLPLDSVKEWTFNGYHTQESYKIPVQTLDGKAIIINAADTGGWHSDNGSAWKSFSHPSYGAFVSLSHEAGYWYLGYAKRILRTADFVTFESVATNFEVTGNASYVLGTLAIVLPGGALLAMCSYSYGSLYGSTDAGKTWICLQYPYNSIVRYSKDLEFIITTYRDSSIQYINPSDFDEQVKLGGYPVNTIGAYEFGTPDLFFVNAGFGIRRSATRDYDKNTEFHLPIAPGLGGFTLNHVGNISIGLCVRAK